MFVAQSCLTLCNPMDSSPPGSSFHGILQAKILEQIVIPFSRRSSWSWDQTQVFCISGRLFTIWATREAPIYLIIKGIFWQRNIYTFYYCVIQITNIVFHPILKNTPEFSDFHILLSMCWELLIISWRRGGGRAAGSALSLPSHARVHARGQECVHVCRVCSCV